MTLEELMDQHMGKWENDVATVSQNRYIIMVATRNRKGEISLLEEGLRNFPDLTLTAEAPKKGRPSKVAATEE